MDAEKILEQTFYPTKVGKKCFTWKAIIAKKKCVQEILL